MKLHSRGLSWHRSSTLTECATPSSGVMLLLFTPERSQADSTTRTCEERVRRDPLPFKNTFASCVFFPQKLQKLSRASLQFSPSHQDKLCTLLTIFCKLALFTRSLMLISLWANNCSMFAYVRLYSPYSALFFFFLHLSNVLAQSPNKVIAYYYVFPTKFIQSQEGSCVIYAGT